MIAARDLEDSPGIGECSLFNILHPGTVHAERYMVFGFTSHGAGMAANTLSVVDDKAVSHSARSFLAESIAIQSYASFHLGLFFLVSLAQNTLPAV